METVKGLTQKHKKEEKKEEEEPKE